MEFSRRTFLKKGLAAAAGALVLPPTLGANAEAARRFWALDATMLHRGGLGARATLTAIDEAAYIDTIHLAEPAWFRPGMKIRIHDIDGDTVLPTRESFRIVAACPAGGLAIAERA